MTLRTSPVLSLASIYLIPPSIVIILSRHASLHAFFKIKSNWMKHNLVSSVTTVEKAVLFCCDEGSDSQDPILAICIRIFHDDSFFSSGNLTQFKGIQVSLYSDESN